MPLGVESLYKVILGRSEDMVIDGDCVLVGKERCAACCVRRWDIRHWLDQ